MQPAEDNEEVFAGAAESELIKEEGCQEKEKKVQGRSWVVRAQVKGAKCWESQIDA